MNGGGIIAFRLRMIMKRSFFEEFFFDLNQGGSTYSLEDKRLEDLDGILRMIGLILVVIGIWVIYLLLL